MSDDPRGPGLVDERVQQSGELALARTQTPPPVAPDRTLTPAPVDLARTHTPPPADEDATASPLLAPTQISNGDREGRTLLLSPDVEDRRVKDLVKSRLFRSKAEPVKIGRFTVLDRLGEGGMGVVYAAYDDQLDRKIAVKVLRGEVTRQDHLGRTRLLREAQAMARLSHPNIVAVHEVGPLDDQQIFIAMEFVRGESLDAWLRARARPWREVLATFLLAGRGLEAAHRAGIVHRDFKPHNVLVGDEGLVKVLDFGLARAAGHAGSEALTTTRDDSDSHDDPDSADAAGLLTRPLTRTGAIMGTPAYMAPEQHIGLPATAYSDQFSFCVSLHEGLYGQHPFDCTTLGRLVVDVAAGKLQEPPPGHKIPAWLRRVLLRGLAVEPERRYPSMAALLAGLARDPAAAPRRSLAPLALARGVGGASFGAASLLPAASAVCPGAAAELADVWDEPRAEAVRKAILATELPYAADTWAHLQPRLDAYAQAWVAMRGEACETHHAARQSDQLFDLRTACLDQRRASLGALVEALSEADAAAVEKAVAAASALPPVAGCGDVAALTQAVPPPDDPQARAQVQTHREALARAASFEQAGQYARGLALIDPVVAAARRLDYPPLLAEALLRRGSVQMAASAHTEADAAFAEATWTGIAAGHDEVAALAGSRRLFLRAARLQQVREALADVPLVDALVRRVGHDDHIRAEYLNNLGVAHLFASDLEHAGQELEAALELKREILPADDPELAYTEGNLANLAMWSRDYAAAILRSQHALTIAERAFGEAHPQTAAFRHNLGVSYRLEGRLKAAEALLSASLATTTAAFGPRAVERQLALMTLGELELARRDYPAAKSYFQQSLDILTAKNPRLDAEAWLVLQGLGDVALAAGDLAEFKRLHTQAQQLQVDESGARHIRSSYVALRYGTSLLRAGLLAEARAQLTAALAAREASESPSSPLLAEALEQVGLLELREGKLDAAEAALTRARQIHEAALPATSPTLALTLQRLGEVLLARGRTDEAAASLRRAVDILAGAREADDHELALARFALARALADADEAARLARQAHEVLAAKGPGFSAEVAVISAWLARRP